MHVFKTRDGPLFLLKNVYLFLSICFAIFKVIFLRRNTFVSVLFAIRETPLV